MKYLLFIPILFLNACAGFQGAADDIEKIADNDAVVIKVEREAIQKDSNLKIQVDLVNDQPVNEVKKP
jgi:hypothetical protein